MSRAKGRGSHGAALFEWTGSTNVEAGEVVDNPRARRCDTCKAAIAEPCTRPSRRGRRIPIRGYHDARTQPSTGVST